MKTVTVVKAGAEEVRDYVNDLPDGTVLSPGEVQALFPHLRFPQIRAALVKLRTRGVLAHNGELSRASRYTKIPTGKRAKSNNVPAPRPEATPVPTVEPTAETEPASNGQWQELITLTTGTEATM